MERDIRSVDRNLIVYAGWAIAGFEFPGEPFPFAMNVVSKLLAFATAVSLCIDGRRATSGTPG